jgi:hypothetical protein
MRTTGRRNIGLALAIAAAVGLAGSALAGPVADDIAQSPHRLQTTRTQPNAYGTQDYTVTVVPAIAFYPAANTSTYNTSLGANDLSRTGTVGTVTNFYAPIDLPRGAIVDYIGLNSKTTEANGLGVAMYRRTPGAQISTVGTFSSAVHDWGTDYNAAPIGYLIFSPDVATILHVQQGDFDSFQYFGHVEVWWRRTVSTPSGVTFNDVPANHGFYQFIEALAESGITAGCGNGNFCPDAPLTRGQMAVFLAKALGLHWGTTP